MVQYATWYINIDIISSVDMFLLLICLRLWCQMYIYIYLLKMKIAIYIKNKLQPKPPILDTKKATSNH